MKEDVRGVPCLLRFGGAANSAIAIGRMLTKTVNISSYTPGHNLELFYNFKMEIFVCSLLGNNGIYGSTRRTLLIESNSTQINSAVVVR